MRRSSLIKAKEMRRNPTPAEALLWQALRNRRLNGLKFTRQHCVGPYIADFYCDALKLFVEVDGEIHDHYQQQIKDDQRDMWCKQHGLHVLRFSNAQVVSNLKGVLETIALLAGVHE